MGASGNAAVQPLARRTLEWTGLLKGGQCKGLGGARPGRAGAAKSGVSTRVKERDWGRRRRLGETYRVSTVEHEAAEAAESVVERAMLVSSRGIGTGRCESKKGRLGSRGEYLG